MEVATNSGGKAHHAARVWRALRSNPDYVADWRAHAGPVAHEAPFPLHRQTVADLRAARWNLLAWEDPRTVRHAELFWADVAMVEARAVDARGRDTRALLRVTAVSRRERSAGGTSPTLGEQWAMGRATGQVDP